MLTLVVLKQQKEESDFTAIIGKFVGKISAVQFIVFLKFTLVSLGV
jgi:hypothetical protein